MDKMPCGNCDAGTYGVTPALNGIEMFQGCQSEKEALKVAPMCKIEPGHICYGARDWIRATEFPFDPQELTKTIKS